VKKFHDCFGCRLGDIVGKYALSGRKKVSNPALLIKKLTVLADSQFFLYIEPRRIRLPFGNVVLPHSRPGFSLNAHPVRLLSESPIQKAAKTLRILRGS
jgi:hypothetical protein